MNPSPAPHEPPSSGVVVRASFHKGEVLRAGNQAFRVTKCLGLGAMGEVYEVEDQNLAVTRVMKVMRPELAKARPTLVDRFLRESRCLAKLRHPSVVGVVLADRLPEGTPFYLMEFVAGRSLAAFLAKKAPLEPHAALPLLMQLASALDAVHAAGIVHRDIKPDNVLIWREHEGLRATLLDFGVMRLLADDTPEGFCGTGRFAAPEHLGGAKPTVKFDIFALGVVAFLMLSRRDPYEDYESPLHRVVRTAPSLADTPGARGVSPELAQLVADMLALEPEKRPTARQVVDRIVGIHEAIMRGSRPGKGDDTSNEELMSMAPLQVTPLTPEDLDAHTLPGSPSLEVLEAARRAMAPTVRGQTVQGVGLGFTDDVVSGVAATELAAAVKAPSSNEFDIHAQALLIAQRAAAARSATKASVAPPEEDEPRPRDSELLEGLAQQWKERQDSKAPAAPKKGAPLVPPPAPAAGTLPMAHRPLPGKGKTVPIAGAPSGRRGPTPSEVQQAIREGNALHAENLQRPGRRRQAIMVVAGALAALLVLAIAAVMLVRGGR